MSNYLKVLPDDVKQIKNALNWIDTKGNLYGIETRTITNRYTKEISYHKHYGEYFQYKTQVNNRNGYIYGNIKYFTDKENKYETKQRRVHILVAETFLPNPQRLPLVGHKNNIKTDNRIENLYWTTFSENTKKAFEDGLIKNDIGYDDSQSKPVFMFDTHTNKLLGSYGSICIASKETGISKSTISRQCRYKRPIRKEVYFRFQDDKSI